MDNFAREKKYSLLITLLLSTIVFSAVYYKFIFGSNIYAFIDIGADTVSNYWPFLNHIYSQLKESDLSFYSFKIGIGSSLYNQSHLFLDPFHFIFYILPKDLFPFGLILTAYFKSLATTYLGFKIFSLFSKDTFAITLYSIALTYSGHLIWSQHYMFHTALPLSLLLILGSERINRNPSDIVLFFLGVFGACLFSMYITYMSLVFFLLYYTWRCLFRDWKVKQNILPFLVSGTLGVVAASVGLLPQLLEVLKSPRITSSTSLSLTELLPFNILSQYALRAINPNFLGIGSSAKSVINYYEDPNIYIGTPLLALALYYIFFYLKGLKKIVVIASFFTAITFNLVPLLMNSFLKIYFRWNYFLIIILLFVSFRMFLLLRSQSIVIFKRQTLALCLIPIVISIASKNTLAWTIDDLNSWDYLPSLTLYYAALLILHKRNSIRFWHILIGLIAVTDLTITGLRANTIRSTISSKDITSNGFAQLSPHLEHSINQITSTDQSIYRIQYLNAKTLNEPIVYSYLGTTTYASLNDASYLSFLKANSYKHPRKSQNIIAGPDLSTDMSIFDALSVKYIISDEPINLEGFSLYKKTDQFLYSNSSFSGFIKIVHPLCESTTALDSYSSFYTCSKELRVNSEQATDIKLRNGSLSFSLDMPKDGTAILSIPFHQGFSFKIDDNLIPLESAFKGLMKIPVLAGKHDYLLTFKQPLIELSLILTMTGFLLLPFVTNMLKRKYKLHRKNQNPV